ncbi:Lariat debranching enzyme [Wickerhamomyces ciferrii]|uniref:Lariat debranching enzyme n=1 Tax=Wickerhamomyces ciferrii (strain ATCC 14091 / BCRC 22168 / CBS 111 / JCM 3599 / NBRC 0793 / NRRL Y-1031 F-60-10) TaxID=1206466 RepID=K0K7Q9_WICCF|nr:Lariat debranching enzyme [Wickerhamomyces ciferrii]CCH40850.1 Lariat debranching enzyme [Wickerhamomyces ciferrii]
MSQTLRIAVEGCCHGELNQIYARIKALPYEKWPELLIICGDFQSIRNETDLSAIAVPDKFKKLGDFQDYYNGSKKAPIPTIFVGGNHEASNYLQELPFGGWVAENIYYLGNSNVIWFKGLRIGSISGIYKYHDFYKPHDEKFPYNETSKRSVYHVRFEDFLKLGLIQNLNLNCFISHDWPEGITSKGDEKGLLRAKPFFKKDIETNSLGSVPAKLLLNKLMPNWWFSAHLHVKFEATVEHPLNNESNIKRKLSNSSEVDHQKKTKINNEEIDLGIDEVEGNNDEISLDLEDEKPTTKQLNEIKLDLDDDEITTPIEQEKSFAKGFSQTNFLALDKCLPRRRFLEYLEIPITNDHPHHSEANFYYDPEFLKINKWFENNFRKTEVFKDLRMRDFNQNLIDQLWKDINDVKINDESLEIPKNFKATLENPSEQTKLFKDKFL